MKDYHSILNLNKNASKSEIKKAYRKLALKYHPDRNHAPGAKEQFLEIAEAYEMLTSPVFQFKKASQQQQEAAARAQAEARQRAQAYARMKREEFKKSDAYKMHMAEVAIVDQLYLISAYFLVFISPILSFLFWGKVGLITDAVILFLSWAYWIDIFTTKKRPSISIFTESLVLVSKTEGFKMGALIIFSIYVFFNNFPDAVIPHKPFLYAFLIWHILFFIIYSLVKTEVIKLKNWSFIYALPMAFIMMVFFVNDTISWGGNTEIYPFKQGAQYRRRGRQNTTEIHLPNNKYDKEFLIRYFLTHEELTGRNWIKYEFKRGLFGIKVLKDYSLSALPFKESNEVPANVD